MSTRKVKVNNLTSQIMDILENYVDDIEDIVKEETNSTIKEAKSELVSISPKAKKPVKTKSGKTVNPGDYAKSWAIGTRNRGKHKYSKVVHNKKHYRLTHLLEFEHVTRDGTSYTKAQPHIRPTEEKYKLKLLVGISSRVRRG